MKKPAQGGLFVIGDPAGIRTPDTLLKRQVLCRLSYWVRSKKFCAEYEIKSYAVMAGTAGFAFAAAKATAVTICHRHIAKSRLSNPRIQNLP